LLKVGFLGLMENFMNLTVPEIDLPPMLRFAIVLSFIFVMPYLTRKLRIPSVVGFILVGVLIGPHGIGIMPKNAEVANFFAELGKLLLMFFVGLEIDLRQFKINQRRSLVFGLTTFTLPMVAGFAAGVSFGYPFVSAALIGSLLASHTLIGYPIIRGTPLASRPAVTITVGATVLTDILSLLILAVCLTTHKTGFDPWSLIVQLAELAGFVLFMIIVVARFGRWLFDRLRQTDEACFLLMLTIVAAGSAFAEAIQLEGILGAFMAGLAVNAAVRDAPARAKLEFLGNNLFIPAFFIVTGFLIDIKLFAATVWSYAAMVAAIVLGLIVTKWLAAEAVGRAWGFPAIDRGLMTSLTIPQVAATLAAALVGYQALNAAGQPLIDGPMLNTVLVLVVVTSVLGPVLTERFVAAAARREALGSADAARRQAGEETSPPGRQIAEKPGMGNGSDIPLNP